jgi:hypothetical protein
MDLLSRAVKFEIDEEREVYVTARKQRDGSKLWVVERLGLVLNSDCEFEYEPMPSSRTDDFIARTRFSLEQALQLAERYLNNRQKGLTGSNRQG